MERPALGLSDGVLRPPFRAASSIFAPSVRRSAENVFQREPVVLRCIRALRRVVVLVCAPLVVLVALGVVFAPAAQADCEDIRWKIRWAPDLSGTTGGSLIRVPVCGVGAPSTTPTKPKTRKAKPKEPTRSQLRALRFRPSEEVSATVRERMIEQLAYGEQAEQIRAQIDSGDLKRQFDASMRRQGWSTRDLGDMYSLAYLQLWMVANDRSEISTRVGKAVREDLRRQLALDAKFGRADDATQQELAEWLGSWTVVLGGAINHVSALGDPASIERVREYARELIREPDLLDVDLTQVRLTQRGIERR
jgi:hypothetical protein